MIEQVESEKGIERFNLNFATFFPAGYEVSKISVRHHDKKWPTVRYEFSGKASGRVKQFFMDWFYYGFPKNLMSSLIDSYSHVDAFRRKYLTYFGKDYKGMDAATASIKGTHIEVEFNQGELQDRIEFMNSLKASDQELQRISTLRYHERGFHTLGNPGDWFEDLRISRLKWQKLDDRLEVGNQLFAGSSEGILESGGKIIQAYRVYQQNGFERAVSIDLWRNDVKLEHIKYTLRGNGNFFNVQKENPNLVLYKGDFGPAFFAFRSGVKEGIIAFSGGFNLDEAERIYRSCIDRINSGFGF